MEEVATIKLEVTGDDAVQRSLSNLEQEIQKTGRATKELTQKTKDATKQNESFTQNISKMKGGLIAGAAALTGLVLLTKKFGNELEATMGVVNRFSGDLTKARAATGGLVSDLELMRTASKFAEGGLRLTSEQLGVVTSKAIEFSAATGVDLNRSLKMLTQSLVDGTSGGLKRFGIALEGVTGQAAIQEAALAQLSGEFDGTGSRADTLGGKLDIMAASANNAWVAFATGFDSTTALNDALAEVGSTVTVSSDTIQEFSNFLGAAFNVILGSTIKTINSLATTLKGLVTFDFEEVEKGFNSYLDNFEAFWSGDAMAKAARDVGAAQQKAINEGRNAELLAGAEATARRTLALGSAADAAKSKKSGAADKTQTQAEMLREELSLLDEKLEREQKLAETSLAIASNETERQMALAETHRIEGEMLLLDRERSELLNSELERVQILQELTGTPETKLELKQEEMDLERELAEIKQRSLDTELDLINKVQKQRTDNLNAEIKARKTAEATALKEKQKAEKMRQNAVTKTGQIEGLAIQSAKLLGLDSLAATETISGLSEIAKSAGSYPDPVGIAQHALSAGLHFAAAAQAGGGGGGGGVGGGAQGAISGAGGGGAGAVPARGGSGEDTPALPVEPGSEGEVGNTTIFLRIENINDRAEAGRIIEEARAATRRRWDE